MVKSFWETPNGLFSTGLVGAFDSLKKNSESPTWRWNEFRRFALICPVNS